MQTIVAMSANVRPWMNLQRICVLLSIAVIRVAASLVSVHRPRLKHTRSRRAAALRSERQRHAELPREPRKVRQRVLRQLQSLDAMPRVVTRFELARIEHLVEAFRERRALEL